MFPVRYGLNSYINLLRNSVFKGLIKTGFMSKFVSETELSDCGLQGVECQTKFGESLQPLTGSRCFA
jgi:hypothetical protein